MVEVREARSKHYSPQNQRTFSQNLSLFKPRDSYIDLEKAPRLFFPECLVDLIRSNWFIYKFKNFLTNQRVGIDQTRGFCSLIRIIRSSLLLWST